MFVRRSFEACLNTSGSALLGSRATASLIAAYETKCKVNLSATFQMMLHIEGTRSCLLLWALKCRC